MSPLVHNYIEVQKLDDLELQEQIAGAGVNPNYLISDAPGGFEVPASDKTEISGPPLANTQVNAVLISSSNSTEEEQYLENTTEYDEAVNGKGHAQETEESYKTVTSPLTSDNSSGTCASNDAVDVINEYDEALRDDVLNVTDDSFYRKDKDGYLRIDGEALEAWERRMIIRTNVLASLLIAISSRFDARRVAEEAFTGISQPEDKNSYKQTFARKIRTLQKIMQQIISKLFEYVNTENQRIYNERIKKIKRKRSWWAKVVNWFTGEYDRKEALAQLEETRKYLEATEANLRALQSAISAVIELLKVSFLGGEMSMVGITMTTALCNFRNRIDKVIKEVDAKLKEVLEWIEKLKPKGFWGSLKDFFIGLITLNFEKMFSGLKGMIDSLARYLGPAGYLLKPVEWLCILGQGLGKVTFGLVKFTIYLIRDYVLPALEYLNPFFYIIQKLRGKGLGWSSAREFAKWEVLGLAVRVVDYAIKGFQWVVNKINELLDKLGWVGLPLFLLFITFRLLDSRKYSFADSAKYVDDLDVRMIISEFRGALVASANAYRAYLSVSVLKHDLRNIALQKFTGRRGVSNDVELLMTSAESVLGHATHIFDALTAYLMLTIHVHNTVVEMFKVYQQILNAQPFIVLSSILTLIAAAAGIASLVFPPAFSICAIIAAIAGTVAGLARAYAIQLMNSITSYEPIEAKYDTPQEEKRLGKTAIDAIENIEIEEQVNLQAMAYKEGMIGRTADGYYYLNTKAFAVCEMRQKIFDNILRSIFSIVNNARDLRRIADAEFTGTSTSDSGESLFQNMVENNIAQRTMLAQAIKFQHMEVVKARNLAKMAEIACEKAGIQALISAASATAGAFVGWLIGPGYWAIMMGLFSALANAIHSIVEAATDNARGMTLDIDCPELDRMLREKGEDLVEARLDNAELRVYQDILNNGIVSTGDGYYGVDFGLVTQAYAWLGRIYALKEALARVRALSSQLRQIAKQEFTGTTIGTIGELTTSVNRASFNVAMRTVGNLVRFLQEKANVMNRAADAEKQFKMALGTGLVNIGFSSAGVVCVSVSPTASATTAVTLKAVAGLMSGVMPLVNSLASLIMAVRAYRSDYGAYNNYDPKTTVDKTGKKVKNAQTVDEKLDELEYELLTSMNTDLVQTLDGSNWVVSPLATKLNSRMRTLYNLREALSIARSILSESRATTKGVIAGRSLRASDGGQDVVDMFKEVSISMLDSLKSALETIVERHNQIEQAKKNIILSTLSVAASAVSLGLSITSSVKEIKASKLEILEQPQGGSVIAQRVQAPSASSNSPTEPSTATTHSTTTTSPTASASDVPSTASSLTTSQEAHSLNSVEEPSGHEEKEVDAINLRREARNLQTAGTIVGLVARFINIATDVSYDAYYNSNQKHVDERMNTKTRGLDSKGSALKEGGAISSLDNMDAEIAEAEYQLSILESHEKARSVIDARADRVLKYLIEEIKSLDGTVKSLWHKQELTYLRIGHPEAAQEAQQAQKPRTLGATPVFWPEENHTPSTRALLDYADQIERKIQENINSALQESDQISERLVDAQREIQTTEAEIDRLNQQLDQLEAQSGQVNLQQLKEQRDALVARRDQLVHKRQQLQADLTNCKARVEQMRDSIRNQIQSIKDLALAAARELENLQRPDYRPELTPEQRQLLITEQENQIARFQDELRLLASADGELSQQLAGIEHELVVIKNRTDSMMQEIQKLNEEIRSLNREIARLQRQEQVSIQASDSSIAQSSSVWESIAALFGISRRSAEDNLRKVERESRQPQAGEVVRDGISQEMVLAVRNSSGNRSFREQYERAQAEEELYRRYLAGGVSA